MADDSPKQPGTYEERRFANSLKRSAFYFYYFYSISSTTRSHVPIPTNSPSIFPPHNKSVSFWEGQGTWKKVWDGKIDTEL